MLEPQTEQDAAKSTAGRKAVETYLRSGMQVGLGSGTTSHWFVRHVAEAMREGLEIVGVPTSSATRDLALELGVPLADLNDLEVLDLTIDGADEIDREGAMIKGGGAALLWERIVANASRRMIAVVDDLKVVDALGAFPLPIEVIPFGWRSTRRSLVELFAGAGYRDVRLELRPGEDGPRMTDSGHYILDAHLERITDKAAIADRLNLIPGVVENGLFVGVAEEMVVGRPDGTASIERLERVP
jgi:ribose 5-phosphate isomerase A